MQRSTNILNVLAFNHPRGFATQRKCGQARGTRQSLLKQGANWRRKNPPGLRAAGPEMCSKPDA
jgi:hypothetical protein